MHFYNSLYLLFLSSKLLSDNRKINACFTMSSSVNSCVSPVIQVASNQVMPSRCLKGLSLTITLLSLFVISLAAYGLFVVPLISTQLVIRIISASITLVALVCSCVQYYFFHHYGKLVIDSGNLINNS